MATTGHEHERVEVQGLKASMKKGGNIGIYNDCICSTAAATAAKVMNTVPPSFSLTAKAKILVKFTYGINVANATLQVGENAAKPIYYQGNALDAGRVKAGMFVLLQYDGTNFNIVGDIAKMDSYYKNLHAGLADNLFGSTQTNDIFTFRPTAGIQDVASGDAPVGGGTIKKVEGNGISWNQGFSYDSSRWTGYGDISFDNNVMVFQPQQEGGYGERMLADAVINGHVYYTCMTIIEMTATFFRISESDNSSFVAAGAIGKYSSVRTATFNTSLKMIVGGTSSQQVTVKNIMFIDLTLLGIDNLTTVEEVEAWLANNVGLKGYYPYNAGELIPVKDFKVKSVGLNAWDEEWEQGNIDTSTGEPINPSANYVFRSKNFCKVLGGEDYHCKFPSGVEAVRLYFYDFSKKFIVASVFNNITSVQTIPTNACYFKLIVSIPAYSGGLCFNLSYDGDRDGEYEEHWEREVGIDVTKVYGKLNGTGDSVQVFPDGLKAAGTTHDEIVRSGDVVKAIKRVGSVDMGTLSWSYAPEQFLTYVADFKYPTSIAETENANISTWRYNKKGYGYNDDKIIFTTWPGSASGKSIRVKDSGYTDASTFATSMSGVLLYYELETPQEYILDENILPIQYRVDNYGTEEVLLGNDEGLVSSSPKMTISYGINAADTIADLPHSYVSVLPQQLDEDKQKQARRNINAASQDDMNVVKKQLELIDKKVENDYYVDMGLPSGLLWAKRNVFTGTGNDLGFAPSEYSYDASYYSWGNIEGHISENNIFDYSFDATTYASTPGSKLTGNISLSYDAARAALGAPWRMPSKDDIQELFDNCDFIDANGDVIASTTTDKLITMNGVVGVRLKSKINGRILFIPCCGYGEDTSRYSKASYGRYWTMSIYDVQESHRLFFYSSGINTGGYDYKHRGFTIRPVM